MAGPSTISLVAGTTDGTRLEATEDSQSVQVPVKRVKNMQKVENTTFTPMVAKPIIAIKK